MAAVISAHLPRERLLYWGDNARVPYGTKSPDVVRRYTYEAASALVERGVKAIVIACNTASASVDLRALSLELNVPIFGMIEAGRLACQHALKSIGALDDDVSSRVIILATPGTIRSGAYQRALTDNIPHVRISPIACPIFVPLVEMGWSDHAITLEIVSAQLRDRVDVISELLQEPHDTSMIALLGCTHYPLMASAIERGLVSVLKRSVRCLDGASSVARLLESALSRAGLLSDTASSQRHSAHFTDDLRGASSSALAEHFWRQRGGVGVLDLS